MNFKINDPVRKIGGSYECDGVIVAARGAVTTVITSLYGMFCFWLGRRSVRHRNPRGLPKPTRPAPAMPACKPYNEREK